MHLYFVEIRKKENQTRNNPCPTMRSLRPSVGHVWSVALMGWRGRMKVYYRVIQKRIPSFIFGITSVIQHRFNHSFAVTSRNLWRVNMKFFHPWPHYLAKQTLLLISVLSVLFYWLNLSLDSIKMTCGCWSQVAMLDVSAAIPDNSFKTSKPFKNSHSGSLITVLINGVDVLKLLSRINVKKLQFIHMLTATDLRTLKTAKIKKLFYYTAAHW